MTYSMNKLDFRKHSKSAKEDCSCCPLFSSLCFSSLRCSFLAHFERLWQRAMELQRLVLHEFELPKALPWTIYNSSSFLDCFGDQKAIKTPKLNTIWLETIVRVLNMLIGLKGNNYYSRVFKRVYYKLQNSTFWVVIMCPPESTRIESWHATCCLGGCRAGFATWASGGFPTRPIMMQVQGQLIHLSIMRLWNISTMKLLRSRSMMNS